MRRDMIYFAAAGEQSNQAVLDALRARSIEPMRAYDEWEAQELWRLHPDALFAYGPAVIPAASVARAPRILPPLTQTPDAYGARGVEQYTARGPVMLIHGKREGTDLALLQQAAAVLSPRYILDLEQVDACNFLVQHLLARPGGVSY